MIHSVEGFTFASALDLKRAIIISNWMLMLMLKSYVQLYSHGSWENIKTSAYHNLLIPYVFQNIMSRLVQNMEYVKTDIVA
jgi:hypothetical protein